MSKSVRLRSENEILSSWGEYSTPLVSICCTTYNHSKFIKDALEGFLIQKTSFPFEIVIFDDASTDETQKIIEDYVKRYPKLFVPFLQKENLWQNKGISGTFTIAFPNARGKYIAWCEGDDYWTDRLKLQKQVDFLDDHPECTICFHDVTEFYDDNSKEPLNSICSYQKEFMTLEDLLKNNFCYTCTTLFKKDVFSQFPDRLIKCGDYPLDYCLWVFYGQHGKIGYIHEVMGVYRIHSGGLYSSKNRIEQLQDEIIVNEYIDRYLNFKYQSIIKNKISLFNYEIAKEYEKQGDYRQAIKYIKKLLNKCIFNPLLPRKQILKMSIEMFVKRLYSIPKKA